MYGMIQSYQSYLRESQISQSFSNEKTNPAAYIPLEVTHMYDRDFYLLGDVARILQVRPHQIVYLLSTRQVPEPAMRLGNRRVFTVADITAIAERLKIQPEQELMAKAERG